MLVGLGDIPKPDQDVLSSTIFPSGSEKSEKSQTNISSIQERDSPEPTPVRPIGSPRTISPNQLPPFVKKLHPRPTTSTDSFSQGDASTVSNNHSNGSDKQPRKKSKTETGEEIKKSSSFNRESS